MKHYLQRGDTVEMEMTATVYQNDGTHFGWDNERNVEPVRILINETAHGLCLDENGYFWED